MDIQQETLAVKEVVQNYIEGTYEADIKKLEHVFHKKAVMNGYLGQELVLATPEAFIEDIKSAPSMASQKDPYKAEIEFVQLNGEIATVILSEKGFRGEGALVDHFHLVKENGEWKIISKLFTTV